MALSGNKGEWSEIYTLFKLLGDGKVHAGDANMNKLELYYPIINIIREESEKYEYQPNTSQHIVIINENGKEYARIKMHKFLEESTKLLTEIKQAKKSAFEIPNTESFMGEIGCSKLKAPSSDKADIHIIIHDLRTNMTPLLGFSIKSQLGHASTLLNAGIIAKTKCAKSENETSKTSLFSLLNSQQFFPMFRRLERIRKLNTK